jgi:hypothetical protein
VKRPEEPLPVPPAPEPLVLIEPRLRGRRSPRGTAADMRARLEVLATKRGQVLTEDDVERALARRGR